MQVKCGWYKRDTYHDRKEMVSSDGGGGRRYGWGSVVVVGDKHAAGTRGFLPYFFWKS